jgi:DNA-binding Lrp family transcriptional regulator
MYDMNIVTNEESEQKNIETKAAENMGDLDFQILSLLQTDSRLSFNKIAIKLGISVGTAFNHVKKMEKEGVLKEYTIVLDSEKMGYGLTALILVQVEGGHLTKVESEVAKATNAMVVYDITGDYDAAIIAKFRDRADLSAFIKNLMATPHVRRTVTNVVLDIIKEDLGLKLQ